MQSSELNCCEKLHIFLKLVSEVQCNSMDKNVDLCSPEEWTAAHPHLTKSPKEEEKSLYVFFCIGASFSIGLEIWCLPYAGFFLK